MKKSESAPTRLFVCVKSRQGKASCAGSGAGELVKSLRNEIKATGEKGSHMDVRPCGCLDLCKKGPVVLVFSGDAAAENKPPKSKKKRKKLADDCFRRVKLSDAAKIVGKAV